VDECKPLSSGTNGAAVGGGVGNGVDSQYDTLYGKTVGGDETLSPREGAVVAAAVAAGKRVGRGDHALVEAALAESAAVGPGRYCYCPPRYRHVL
jgi:carbohydrate-binding DOMON domain-containing protein